MSDERIADLKRRRGDGAERFAAIDAALRPALEEAAALGSAAVPAVAWADIACGTAPTDLAARVRQAGCVVLRGVVPAALARNWNSELSDYLDRNDADGATRARVGPERYATRWRGGRPQIYSVYWSGPQVAARQSPELAAARAWLNRLWRCDGFDPDVDCTYADRMRRRTPGDTVLGLGPHIDGGTVGRWLGKGNLPYRTVLSGDPTQFDPFDGAHRADDVGADDANGCSAFRSWQGWTALTPQGPGDGTLQVLPVARAIAWLLLRPFGPDVARESLCGAEAAPALRLSPQFHTTLLRALVPIPQVEPGDTVWWHPDLVHAVEAAHGGAGDSNVMYIPAAPDCPRNRAFLARQAAAFLAGDSPPDFPPDHLERGFVGRAGPGALSALGRRQMGLE